MKTTRIILYIFLGLIFIQCTPDKKKNEVQTVIFDTDLGNDIDDVLALQMLYNYQEKGLIDLIGITVSKSNLNVVRYIDGFNRFNHKPEIPIGFAYNGVNPDSGKFVCQTLNTIVDGQPILKSKFSIDNIKNKIPEGYVLMRKLLENRPDSSVIVIAVGPVTNLARLIESAPDNYSKLNGLELIKKKVKFLSIMSGTYSNDTFNNPEWNVLQDLKASKIVYNQWPTEIIASGSEVGVRLLYPHQSILNDFPDPNKNPLCVSYKMYEKMPFDRPTWDLTSVLYAIESKESHLDISQKGKISIDENGFSRFTASSSGKHRFLILEKEKTQDVVNRLVSRVTNK
jgi:inosine-uridine nucleoside N-ribohydrolase